MAKPTGKLTVSSLGRSGVILDLNPLEPTLPSDALARAQNATHDPQSGHAGGLRKRPGFERFNMEFAGGVILGGIPMPVAETGGAPAAGGGAIIGTGDATGTGDGTGAPGGTFDGGLATTTPPGSAIFGGGSLFEGARLLVVGRFGSDDTVGQEGGSGWYVSSKGLADSASIQIPPGPPIAPYNFPPTAMFPSAWGTPSCVDNIGVTGLYYASAYGDQVAGTTDATIGNGPPGNPIRNTNGATDTLVATIPVSGAAGSSTVPPPDGDHRSAITCLHYGIDGFIYVTLKDKYTGQSTAGSFGRAFRLSPLTGALVEWSMIEDGGASNFAHVPYCACYFDGFLYFGTFPDAIDEASSLRKTDGAVAISEGGFSGVGAVSQASALISSFAIYNNRLFMGIGIWQTTPTYAAVFSRRIGPDNNGTGIGAWQEVDTSFSATGGAAQNGNYIVSMQVFGDSLYVSWNNPGTNSKIYKVVANSPGNPLDPSITVTEVLSGMNNIPHYLFVDDGVLYAIGSNGGASSSSAFVTTDGTTWTEKSANLPAGATSSSVRPIFFGVDQ